MTLDEIIKKLEEANLVASASVLRREDRIREREEWLRQNELFLAKHREMTAQSEARMVKIDEKLYTHAEFLALHDAMMVKLDEKLDRIAELILKGHNGNGKS